MMTLNTKHNYNASKRKVGNNLRGYEQSESPMFSIPLTMDISLRHSYNKCPWQTMPGYNSKSIKQLQQIVPDFSIKHSCSNTQ